MAAGAIRDAGRHGLTADELAARLDMDRWSIQPRTGALKRKGLIRDSGQRRANCTGKVAIVWIAAMILAAMSERPFRAHQESTFETSPFCGFGEVSKSQDVSRKPLKQATSENWHDPCHITRARLGVAGHLHCRTGRGGARNRADRESHALTAAQIDNLIAAGRHAEKIGLPFTRMISLHWEAAGMPLARMAKATGRFTDLMTKALARHGSGTAWVWVHENGDGKGGHCHLLAHVPADLVPVVAGLQRGWLRRITRQPYRASVIHSKPIGGRLGLEMGNPDLHAINLEAALAYLLKGANADAAVTLGLTRLEPGGCIVGKRCGTSQNIGRKARKSMSQDVMAYMEVTS